jgi:type VI secretion system protein ImpH
MATQVGTEAPSVIGRATREAALDRELLGDVHSFRFFQAVRLLQRLHPERARVGLFGHPGDEILRFGANPDLAFPASEIQDLAVAAAPAAPWSMTVNFLGLVGHMGVLPHHYSVLVMERERSRDRALRVFLDLFHHRLLALFYRAWERYRFYVPFERGEEDRVTSHLFDLIGLGEPGARRALDLDPHALLGYVGLLGPHQRSALALQQMLEDYFDVPVEVEQFVGAWYDMSATAQCRIDDEADDESGRLGYGALVGDEVWDPGSRARIVVGPLPLERYREFLPTGDAYRALRAITRFFADDQIEFELRLILEKDEVPALSLGAADATPLGWSTWLRSAPFTHDASDTVLSL